MNCEFYFHNCSKEYVDLTGGDLFQEISDVVRSLPQRETQSKINEDLFWTLTDRRWCYDTTPAKLGQFPPKGLLAKHSPLSEIKRRNDRSLCATSTTLGASWHADFGKQFANGLVQVEAQFGKVESMFKDFCGFKIGGFERRVALGIEIVLSEPAVYFAHRKNAIGGMAYFDIARKTLPAINLDTPIWLIGIKES
jgi:hypothetical protein